jgi:hypothetical protein
MFGTPSVAKGALLKPSLKSAGSSARTFDFFFPRSVRNSRDLYISEIPLVVATSVKGLWRLTRANYDWRVWNRPMRPSSFISPLTFFAISALLAACGTLPRLAAVPPNLTEQAVIPGIPNSRFWLDRDLGPFIQSVVDDFRREKLALGISDGSSNALPPLYILGISGGGDDGPFAAGLSAGWTVHGDRPQFKTVTGISAGALIAPFAFLGPQYDDVIRRVATSAKANNIFHFRNLLVGLASDGMADSGPLARLVAQYVTPELLEEIAREFAKGRVLEIGTTDLDAGRPVTWNMGAIASSRSPEALKLFRNIMIASPRILGAVSSVMIDVEVLGSSFQEMHVDGGVITQVFLYPSRILPELAKATGAPLRRAVLCVRYPQRQART